MLVHTHARTHTRTHTVCAHYSQDSSSRTAIELELELELELAATHLFGRASTDTPATCRSFELSAAAVRLSLRLLVDRRRRLRPLR